MPEWWPSLPPGAALLAAASLAALVRSAWSRPVVLLAVAAEWARLGSMSGAISGSPDRAPRFGGDDLSLASASAVLIVVALSAVAGLGRRTSAREGGALALSALALAASQANGLHLLALLLLAIGALEGVLSPGSDDAGRDPASGLPTASSTAWRAALLVSLVSAALVATGASSRVSAGGVSAVEWIGIPLAGDTPTTLLFVGLLLPLVLPASLGGALHGMQAGPIARSEILYLAPGVLRTLVLLTAFSRCFQGTERVAQLGTALALLAVLPAVLGRRAASRALAAAAHAGVAALLAASAIGTRASEDAFALGLIGLALAVSGAGMALVHATAERTRDGALGTRGLARLFPTVFVFSLLSGLGLAAQPGTLAFEARSRAGGAFAVEGEGLTALAFAATTAPVAALCVLPFFLATFFSRGMRPLSSRSGPRPGALRKPSFALHAALALAGAGGLALGIVPGALKPVLPHATSAPDRFPSVLATWELTFAGLLVTVLFARRLLSTQPDAEAPVSSAP